MTYPAAVALVDRQGRALRAERINRVLADFSKRPLAESALLDVGASHGLITIALAEGVKFAVGVDVDRPAITAAASEAQALRNSAFAIASATQLPFKDECFDIVVCNHVYEHVPDAVQLMHEIHRVMKPGACCYFAGGHRLQLLEPHYRLPLLSWLPRSVAHGYLRLSGRGQRYEEKFLAPWNLHRLFKEFPDARDITADLLRRCARYRLGPAWLESLFQAALPRPLAKAVGKTLPTHVWLLRK